MEDSLKVATMLAEVGADAIHVSAGIHASRPFMSVPGMMVNQGVNVEAAAEFKKILEIPIIVAGRIKEPQMAKEIVNSGKADLVALGRPLIADPDWANLARDNREDDIRRCLACNDGCLTRLLYQKFTVGCTVNPAAGNEREFSLRLTTVKNKKTIAVVGGGPAGMEAARIAALRGFKVILFEQNHELGGMVLLAAKATKRHELIDLVRYYQNLLPKLDVDIRLGVRFNAALAKSLNIDTVVVATGGRFVSPPILGVEKGHVVPAYDVLTGSKETGKRCMVIGGGLTGLETAEHLAEKGKEVMLVVRSSLAKNSTRSDFVYYEERLKELDVDIHTKTTILEIKDDGVLIEENEWKKLIVGIDSVVLATGLQPDDALVQELKPVVSMLHSAGDCVVPGRIINAVSGGAEVALTI
jgi:NADPH-dependent 2,4-dienoyl-CoA reductase/sulfur reductase-like enzyme